MHKWIRRNLNDAYKQKTLFCSAKCDHTKIHSSKNCASIQHLNATLANGEGRGKSLNAPIFKKLNA